jgi:hypothetical protein
VADPEWTDPLDVANAASRGGRWNPSGGFGVLYLNASVEVARANVERLYVGLPYGPEDLDPTQAPLLVSVDVLADEYVDAVSDEGLAALGLPTTYPVDAQGGTVPHSDCQPIGQAAYDDHEPGIGCRSAAPGASGEELAWFALPDRTLPPQLGVKIFDEWFWPS